MKVLDLHVYLLFKRPLDVVHYHIERPAAVVHISELSKQTTITTNPTPRVHAYGIGLNLVCAKVNAAKYMPGVTYHCRND